MALDLALFLALRQKHGQNPQSIKQHNAETQDGVKWRTEAGACVDTKARDAGTSYTAATGW